MQTKKIKHYTDTSLGFPVLLSDVMLVKVRDEWVPKVDYPRVTLKVLQVLSHLARPLTGHEIRFVRLHFELTQAEFAAKFGISHVAVHKWEKRGSLPTGMQWSTEKDLRLFIQSMLSTDPKAVGKLYEELTQRPASGGRKGSKRPDPVAA
jgi:hypothetical protein